MGNQGSPLSSWPDRDLVVAFKAGEPEAYDEMYRRYSARVMHVCRKMLLSNDDALEATQETFLKAYMALPRFNGEYKLGAWLARIAGNVCLDHIRRRSRTASVTQLTSHHEALTPEPGPEESLLGDVPAMRTLEHLQPLHAEALRMRSMQGMSHKEIAAQLSMTPMQVKALLHRARASFKRAWGEASGWVLAPFFGVRSFLTQSSRDPAGVTAQFSSWGQFASPLLAEKVAASAMVVAIAISGAATVEPAPTSPSTSHRSVTEAAPFAMADKKASQYSAQAAASEPQVAPREKSATALDKVEDLIAQVQKAANPEDPEKSRNMNEGEKGEERGIEPPSADRASSQAMRKASKIVEDILPDH